VSRYPLDPPLRCANEHGRPSLAVAISREHDLDCVELVDVDDPEDRCWVPLRSWLAHWRPA
jgi:hypothetical protein